MADTPIHVSTRAVKYARYSGLTVDGKPEHERDSYADIVDILQARARQSSARNPRQPSTTFRAYGNTFRTIDHGDTLAVDVIA